ncbi:peptidoglycan binding domain protein [Ostertagia ostertagi]
MRAASACAALASRAKLSATSQPASAQRQAAAAPMPQDGGPAHGVPRRPHAAAHQRRLQPDGGAGLAGAGQGFPHRAARELADGGQPSDARAAPELRRLPGRGAHRPAAGIARADADEQRRAAVVRVAAHGGQPGAGTPHRLDQRAGCRRHRRGRGHGLGARATVGQHAEHVGAERVGGARDLAGCRRPAVAGHHGLHRTAVRGAGRLEPVAGWPAALHAWLCRPPDHPTPPRREPRAGGSRRDRGHQPEPDRADDLAAGHAHPAPDPPRPPDRRAQPPRLRAGADRGPGQPHAGPRLCAGHDRHRPLQAHQRRARPCGRRRGAAALRGPRPGQPAAMVAVVGLDAQHATVVVAGKARRLPLDELASAWRGEFATFWRPPPGYAIRASNIVPLREWLGAQLAGLQTAAGGASAASAPTPSWPELSRQIQAFQAARGLQPDGRVGPVTLMLINQAADVPEPRLDPAS